MPDSTTRPYSILEKIPVTADRVALLQALLFELKEVPVTGQVEEKKQASVASGFSFQMKKAPEKTVVQATELKLQTRLDPLELGATLTEWFAAAYRNLQEFGETGIHLAVFDVQHKQRQVLSYPLFSVPIQLEPQPARGVFHVRKSPLDPFYFEEAGKLFQRSSAILPVLPENSAELVIERLLRDIEDQGVGLGDFALQPALYLVLSKPLQLVPEGPFAPEEPVGTLQQLPQPLSELFPSQRDIAVEAVMGGKMLSSDSIDVRANLAVQCATAAVLENAPVLVLADDNLTLSFIEKKLLAKGANRFCFPLFKSADRYSFRELVAESIDRTALPASAEPLPVQPMAQKFFEALTQKRTAFNLSPAELAHYLLENEKTAEVPLAVPSISNWTVEQLEQFKGLLSEYSGKPAGFASEAFWKQVHAPILNAQAIAEVKQLCESASAAIRNISAALDTAAAKTGLEAPKTLAEVALFEKRLEELDKAPEFPKPMLLHEWSPVPEKVKELLKLLHQAQDKEREIGQTFHSQILDEHLEELLPRLQSQSLSPMRFLNQRYKKDVSRLKAYTFEPEKIKKLDEFWGKLQTVRGQQKLLKRLGELRENGERFFGKEWNGISSNHESLSKKVEWLEHFEKRRMRRFFISEELMKQFLTGADRKVFNRQAMQTDIRELEDSIRHLLLQLLLDRSHPLHNIRMMPFPELEQELVLVSTQLDSFEAWEEHKSHGAVFGQPPLSEFLSVMSERSDIRPDQYAKVFEKSFFAELLQRILAQDPDMQGFTFRHLKEITGALNAEIDRLNAVGPFLISRHAELMRLRRIEAMEAEPAFAFVQHELKKSSRFLPLEPFLARAGKVLVMNAPLWLIRTGQLEKLRPHLPLFKAIVTVDVSDKTRTDISAQFGAYKIIHVTRPVAPQKQTLGFGMKPAQKPLEAVSISMPRFNHPWRTPAYETVPVNAFGQGQIPFEIFEVLHDSALDGRITVVFPDEAGVQEFWNQCTTLFSKDQTIRAWYSQPLGTKKYRFVAQFSEAESASDHAVVIMKKNSPAKTGLSFGIKKETANSASPAFPRELLSRIKGRILLLGEPGMDASPFMEPEAEIPKNRFSGLVSSIGYEEKEWQIRAGHHTWEASLRHHATGKTFYILADLPDETAASLPDRFDYAGRFFNGAIAFSALAALRDKETALSRVFELAEENLPIKTETETSGETLAKEESAPENESESVRDNTALIAVSEDLNTLSREAEPSRIPAYERINSKQDIQRPDPSLLPKFEPYALYNGSIMGDRQDFFEAPERRIQKLMGEIVDAESPIHVNNLYRAVTAYWQIQRRDSHVQSVFTRQLSEMLKKKRFFLRNGCLFSSEDFRINPRNRAEMLDFVLSEEIPLDEIQAVLVAVLERIAPLEPEDLLECVSWTLGLPARFRGFDKRFEKALALLGDQKICAWYRTAVMLHPDVDPRKKSVGL